MFAYPFRFPIPDCPCCFSQDTSLPDEDLPLIICLRCGYLWDSVLPIDDWDIWSHGAYEDFNLPSGDQPSLMIE